MRSPGNPETPEPAEENETPRSGNPHYRKSRPQILEIYRHDLYLNFPQIFGLGLFRPFISADRVTRIYETQCDMRHDPRGRHGDPGRGIQSDTRSKYLQIMGDFLTFWENPVVADMKDLGRIPRYKEPSAPITALSV